MKKSPYLYLYLIFALTISLILLSACNNGTTTQVTQKSSTSQTSTSETSTSETSTSETSTSETSTSETSTSETSTSETSTSETSTTETSTPESSNIPTSEITTSNKDNTNTDADTDTYTNTDADTYRIVESTTSGSSETYELAKNDEFITNTLPEEVAESFKWPQVLSLSPDNNAILYMKGWELKIYDLRNKKISYLMTFLDTTEGLNCKWNPKGNKIACISVNQENYDSLTKIFVLDLNPQNYSLTKKKEFSETVQYVCGSICYADFSWEGESTLNYSTHEIIDPPQRTIKKQV